MNSNRRILTGVSAFVVVACAAGCDVGTDLVSDTDSNLTCGDATSDADVDAKVRVFVQATSDLDKLSGELRGSAKQACANIARDLGAEDTWSGVEDEDEATQRACDGARAKIEAIVSVSAQANLSLVVTRGQCHQDFEQIRECDRICKDQETCDSGTVETRCEPGGLSVVCEGSCKASAECEGSAQVEANCMGKCESTCVGECHGTCTKPDGTRTENDPNCNGKCSASCNGKCRGICKVEAQAGIQCGANVRCKGGCEGHFTEPVCETTCTPPKCTVDRTCYDSCSTRAEAKTVCDPTRVELFCNGAVSAEVQKLQTTINANLGALVDVAEVKGKLVLSAAEKLATSGEAVVKAGASLNAKSAACAIDGAKASVSAAARIKVGVEGSAGVVKACDPQR